MKKKKTNWRKKIFNWHSWAGIAFAIPVLLVSLTAILIAHEDGLGTEKALVKIGWLPGYQTKDDNVASFLNDAKAHYYHDKKEISYYGTKLGLISKEGKQVNIIKETQGAEVRDIINVDKNLWVATKLGLFQYNLSTNKAKKVLGGDFHGISSQGNKLMAMAGKHGFYFSKNHGTDWSSSQKLASQIDPESLGNLSSYLEKSGIQNKLSWKDLIVDIHTGEAFFGEGSMWVWIDLIGLSLLMMLFTGIWMWYKRKFRKPKKTSRKKQLESGENVKTT